MLLLRCPWCGERPEWEFKAGGQGDLCRPAHPDTVTDAVWAEYLYFRDNPKGLHRERWYHAYGCRRWFVVSRDTVTHEIKETYPPDLSQLESSS